MELVMRKNNISVVSSVSARSRHIIYHFLVYLCWRQTLKAFVVVETNLSP